MPTSPTEPTASPTPPDPGDRSTFSSRAVAWASWVKNTFISEMYALAVNAYNNAAEAAASAVAAAASVVTAAGHASTAETHKNSAASSAASAAAAPGTTANSTTSLSFGLGTKNLVIETGKTIVPGASLKIARASDPGKWMLGDAISYNSGTGDLQANVTLTSATGGPYTDWKVSLSGPAGPTTTLHKQRTSNTKIVATDINNIIEVTSGTFTQTWDPVASLGAGFEVVLWNSGSGEVTLDPDGSEQIDGLGSFVMYSGEMRRVYVNEAVTALKSMVLKAYRVTYTASGSRVDPPGYTGEAGRLWGGGGAGESATSGTGDVGGGGGGACNPFFRSHTPGSVQSIVIGAGGATSGAVGGTSTYAGFSAYGGGGGGGSNSADRPGGGGGGIASAGTSGGSATSARAGGQPRCNATAPVGNSGYGGGDGGYGTAGGNAAYGGGGGGSGSGLAGGDSYYGGGGGGGSKVGGSDGSGGNSVFGGDGGAAGVTGTNGQAPGGGGGAARGSTSPGLGARGELDVWGVI